MTRRAHALALALALGVGAAAASCAGGPQCTKNSDCTFGTHCAAGKCYAECRADMDCQHGLVCEPIYGRCTTRDDDGGVIIPPQTDAGAPADAAHPAQTDAAHPAQTDGAAQSDAVAGTGAYPDPCQHGSECASAMCLGDPWGGPDAHCLPSFCASNAQCQMGDACTLAKAPINQYTCLPIDCGNPCTTAGQCLWGCLGSTSAGFCTWSCSAAADCPAGWACYPFQGQAVCYPPDPTACTDYSECLMAGYADCIALTTGATVGSCLNPCRSVADCPAGFTCQTIADSPTGISTYCIPPSAGTGLLGATCANDGDVCQSGLCLTSYCTAPCGVTHLSSPCPHGYGCAPVPNGSGGQTMVCVVSGPGGFDASCSDGSGCESGLCVGSPGYCTKFCNDSFCPTGTTCQDVAVTADGIALKACGH